MDLKDRREEMIANGISGQNIYRREDGSICVETVNVEPTMTDPQFQEDTDVNKILAKYMKAGLPLPEPRGQFVDLSSAPDFHEAMNTVVQAEAAFASLDAHVRARFGNDPGMLLAFLDDPQNYDEAEKLGLLSEEAITKRKTAKNATNANNVDNAMIKPQDEPGPKQ